MDCKKLIMYGLIILVGLYLLKDICGVNIPFIEGFFGGDEVELPEVKNEGVINGEVKEQVNAQPVDPSKPSEAIINKEVPSCKKHDPLSPKDLLPSPVDSNEVQKFNEQHPDGEGILKGVNYLDATFHAGVNTVGQSLRNANLNLRAEPPNPRVIVSPWLNSTIDSDLSRKPLSDNLSK